MGPELFDAVEALLVTAVPDHVTVHDTDASSVAADGANYPYLVLSGGVPRQYGDAVGACRGEADALVRVTHTALDPGQVRVLMRASRSALEDARPEIPGWHGLELVIEDSSGIDVDRDVQIVHNSTARFPFYGVDIYRVRATR